VLTLYGGTSPPCPAARLSGGLAAGLPAARRSPLPAGESRLRGERLQEPRCAGRTIPGHSAPAAASVRSKHQRSGRCGRAGEPAQPTARWEHACLHLPREGKRVRAAGSPLRPVGYWFASEQAGGLGRGTPGEGCRALLRDGGSLPSSASAVLKPGRPGHAPRSSEGTGDPSCPWTADREVPGAWPERNATAQTPTAPGAGRLLQTRMLHPSGEAGMCWNQPWLLSQLDPAPFSPTHGRWDTMTKYLSTRCAVPPSPACQRTGRVCHRGVKRYQMLPACRYRTRAPTRLQGGGWNQGRRVRTQTRSLRPGTCARTPGACPDEPVPPAVPKRGNICTLPAPPAKQLRRQLTLT